MDPKLIEFLRTNGVDENPNEIKVLDLVEED